MSLGSIVGVVAGKLGDLLMEEAKLLYGVEEEVKSLQLKLKMMTSFVEDMDEEGDDARTKTTVSEIRKLAYDAEDLIDYYIIKVGDSKEEGFIKRYACFCGSISRTYTLASEIKAIKVRIDGTMEEWKRYFGGNWGGTEGRDQRKERTRFKAPTIYPHNHEDHVVGLEEDINKLVGVLTAGGSKIEVVSIVGMGGSGKTTLARKLHNHASVKTHFDCTAWASISQEWVAENILHDLLERASGQPINKDEARLPKMTERLHQYLENKRYLIVLDDVWEKQVLEKILLALPSANDCRKIIVTTRKQEVVDFPGLKCINHEPRSLSEEEGWELFRNMALIHMEESSDSVDMTLLEALGKEMLRKCEGLPLAVIALAGILRKKETLEEWEKIKKSVSAWIMDDGRGTNLYGPVNKMLALSYSDLRRELKPCFLYLANFPEDCEIKVKQLIRMWIAEGFITSNKLHEGETLEDVAQGYLDELIHQYVVQIAKKNYDGIVKSIRMHDLVRDLCIKKAKEQDFTEILTSEARDSNESRRLALYNGVYNSILTKSQPLRSLIYNCRENVDLQLICQNFRLLRVLVLQNIQTSDVSLPTEMGSLIHLRYLCLWDTDISELPSSVGKLRNLQTLESNASDGVRIPDVLWEIKGLKHVDCHLAWPIEGKLKLDTLKSLQTLSYVEGGDWMLEGLPLLSQTVQKLEIFRITSQEQLDAVFQCPSIKFDRLHSLHLKWYTNFRDEDGVVMLKNLEPIVHCRHLRELSLYGRIADRSGGCDIQFPNRIKYLRLCASRLETEAALEALGKLPSLIILRLSADSYVGTKWNCFAGEFPQLKELEVRGLRNLEEWSIEGGAMPRLRELVVRECEKLRKLPERLKFITGLQESRLTDMSDEFEKRVSNASPQQFVC